MAAVAPIYVADTVALVHYLTDSLPTKADAVFEGAEAGKAIILVPDISVAEFIYIALKGRLRSANASAVITELLDDMKSSSYLRQTGFPPDAWSHFMKSKVPELHDRMIHAMAVFHEAEGIITNDRELASSGFRTIW